MKTFAIGVGICLAVVFFLIIISSAVDSLIGTKTWKDAYEVYVVDIKCVSVGCTGAELFWRNMLKSGASLSKLESDLLLAHWYIQPLIKASSNFGLNWDQTKSMRIYPIFSQ